VEELKVFFLKYLGCFAVYAEESAGFEWQLGAVTGVVDADATWYEAQFPDLEADLCWELGE
jgi:hypothetical protein